jgi:four helix bundle protein
MSNPLRYQTLVAWQRADDLFLRLHYLTKQAFPPDERFVLAVQLRRAALSVPTNIVEGISRHYPGETTQFLRTSWASLAEVGYLLHVARRLDYLDDKTSGELDAQVRQVAAPLLGLIRQQQARTKRPTPR